MKSGNAGAPTLEQGCPACGGLFTVAAVGGKKKVQCPHCRGVVILGGVNGAGASVEEMPAPHEWMERCEMLQARIEMLEQQVEGLLVTPRVRSSLIPEGCADTREGGERGEILRNDMPAVAAGSGGLTERSLQASTPEIGVSVCMGDGEARRVAEMLVKVLAGAGWKVRGVVEDEAASDGCRGLILAAAPAISLQLLTGTLEALRAAGCAVTFQLDPERGAGETVLIVGAGLGSGDEAGVKN